jgi:predicted amidophosphoribosyltransferase
MSVLDLILPRRCVVCSVVGALVCAACCRALPRLGEPFCARCGAPTAWPVSRCAECAGRRLAFRSARGALAYDGPVRTLVGAWKERGLRTLAAFAADRVAEAVPPPHAAVLTWVPADRDRRLERGHHPAERLARELARRWDAPADRLLDRPGRSARQTGLTTAQRRRNVAGAFVAVGRAPPRVVLLDDVYTTGATVSAAARALRRAGARDVDVVTVARALR